MLEHNNRGIYRHYQDIKNLDPSKNNTSVFSSERVKQYYSDLDMEIYINDFYIDEITEMSYTVHQNSFPVFGYNSYVYDEMMVGSRFIQGEFRINFTNPEYIYSMLNKIHEAGVKSITGEINNFKNSYYDIEHIDLDQGYQDIYNDLFNDGGYEPLGKSAEPLFKPLVAIEILYGSNKMINKHHDIKPKHIILEDVMILSCSQETSITGEPISEVYKFVARDIDTK